MRKVTCVVEIPMEVWCDSDEEVTPEGMKEEFRAWDPVTWKDEINYGNFTVRIEDQYVASEEETVEAGYEW